MPSINFENLSPIISAMDNPIETAISDVKINSNRWNIVKSLIIYDIKTAIPLLGFPIK